MREAGAPDAQFFDTDMRKPAAIEAMMEAVISWGGPDILVNNAGIQQTASLTEVTQQVWDEILASICRLRFTRCVRRYRKWPKMATVAWSMLRRCTAWSPQ
jgi:NAD(P)-dependent dehydrogenase (short-subunit alcohol dehydrogenase family)